MSSNIKNSRKIMIFLALSTIAALPALADDAQRQAAALMTAPSTTALSPTASSLSRLASSDGDAQSQAAQLLSSKPVAHLRIREANHESPARLARGSSDVQTQAGRVMGR